eukprot:Gregarina_sp_Poly_1__5751@NODE_3023_length_1445_cov_4539_508708_g1912_i0_p1_GENE_NODE_3023_length_1445_cov_4539_508708_g1912_i0NODE_3023_length_1445_cov_4539_508708_g1912_i0_p1_ORF_typecomplete_len191_score17_04Integrin_beta/PF00362_18/5_4e24VWA/PF00092_28/2_6e05VWA_2/PF13519_6/0_0002_NODE_3023_length_1445_cov_4539_508708_g1912_i06551227
MRIPAVLPVVGLVGLAEEICYLPIDVLFVQDTTGSFEDDLPNVVRQIPSMVSNVLEQNPESWFGVSEFKDKPYFPLGELADFCYRLEGPLTGSVDDFRAAYAALYASGGGDLPEATFHALINSAVDPAVGWRPVARPARAHEAGARLIILSTDAVPHLPGDIDRMYPGNTNNIPMFYGAIFVGLLSFLGC